jgi:phage-related protein
VPTVLLRQGARFAIRAWGDEQFCALIDFLAELERDIPTDQARLLYLIRRTADLGPPHDERQCRALQGKHAEGLFEFKMPGGARVLWFYDEGSLIICSHGFVKKKDKTPSEEIKRAQTIRTQYLREKKNG